MTAPDAGWRSPRTVFLSYYFRSDHRADEQVIVAAIHLFGPRDILPAEVASGADDTTTWIALLGQAGRRQPPSGVTLYIHRNTYTTFPKNHSAAEPAPRTPARVHESRQTPYVRRLATDRNLLG